MQPAGRIGNAAQPFVTRKKEAHLNELDRKLRNHLTNLQDNYEMILYRAKQENTNLIGRSDPYQLATDAKYECSVRAGHIVGSCEGIIRLIAELRRELVLSDFTSPAASVAAEAEERARRRDDLEIVANRLRTAIATDLREVLARQAETAPPRPPFPSISNSSTRQSAETMAVDEGASAGKMEM